MEVLPAAPEEESLGVIHPVLSLKPGLEIEKSTRQYNEMTVVGTDDVQSPGFALIFEDLIDYGLRLIPDGVASRELVYAPLEAVVVFEPALTEHLEGIACILKKGVWLLGMDNRLFYAVSLCDRSYGHDTALYPARVDPAYGNIQVPADLLRGPDALGSQEQVIVVAVRRVLEPYRVAHKDLKSRVPGKVLGIFPGTFAK